MRHVLLFFKKIGELKGLKRQGILYYGYKDADSAADHTFRLAIMAWLLGKDERLNVGKAMKLALVHDLCKVYTGDITPYDGLFTKKGEGYKLAWRWRRLPLKEKQRRFREKFKKEQQGLKKLVARLPESMRQEVMSTWLEYQKLDSREAKFVSQLDRVENLLEALEAWEQDKRFPTLPWWEHTDEVVDNKALLALLEEISNAEVQRGKRKEGE